MRYIKVLYILLILFALGFINAYSIKKISLNKPSNQDNFIKLLNKRRSIRQYSNLPLNIKQLAYILYAGNARTPKGNRTAPSAGALYPIDIFVYANKVIGLSKGIYFYNARYHYLQKMQDGDFSGHFKIACYYQNHIKNAAALIILIYEKRRMEYRYKEKSINFAYIEAGHISQNVLLALTQLGLAGVPVGAFDAGMILKPFGYKLKKRVPLYVNAVGNKSG